MGEQSEIGTERRKLGDVMRELVHAWGSETISLCDDRNKEIAGDAMFKRANYHLIGWGLFEKDREKAIHWLKAAQEKSYPVQPLLNTLIANPDYACKGDWQED